MTDIEQAMKAVQETLQMLALAEEQLVEALDAMHMVESLSGGEAPPSEPSIAEPSTTSR